MSIKKLALLFVLILAAFAAACSDDDKDKDSGGNSGGSKEFDVPAYTDGGDCSDGNVMFCDGNKLVSCKNGKYSVKDCDDKVCIWFPGIAKYMDGTHNPSPMAECVRQNDLDEEYEVCSKAGEVVNECAPAGYLPEATIVNKVCLAANDGKNRLTFYDDDTHCDSTTCSEDGKSCGE